jgi:sarcosine oxidase, subunit gamma
MVKAFLRQSPLAHLQLAARRSRESSAPAAAVGLAEIPHRCQFVLRGQATDPAFVQAIEKALDLSLPTTACSASERVKDLQLLWMGPDEWLLVASSQAADRHLDKLAKAVQSLHVALVDVSESRTVIRLDGMHARSVLNKGCSIDLHPRAFVPDRVVGTRLARCHVILHQTQGEPTAPSPVYEIYVHRSFSEYLWSWLEDAASEYGYDITS